MALEKGEGEGGIDEKIEREKAMADGDYKPVVRTSPD